ncbi:MAG TPA: hypothetical protein PKZ76_01660 [Xanthomonadaceae bacterium]|nr:hypothetical protein [Xanthomonadaceae bacterium]
MKFQAIALPTLLLVAACAGTPDRYSALSAVEHAERGPRLADSCGLWLGEVMDAREDYRATSDLGGRRAHVLDVDAGMRRLLHGAGLGDHGDERDRIDIEVLSAHGSGLGIHIAFNVVVRAASYRADVSIVRGRAVRASVPHAIAAAMADARDTLVREWNLRCR